jgi:spoIIIJ-associated protein
MKTNEQKIEEIIRTILGMLGITVEKIDQRFDEKMKTTRFEVVTPDARILLVEYGARLQALNYVVKKIVEQMREKGEITAETSFFIDVNNFQGKRIDDLRIKASMIAERARYFRTAMPMEPMTAYERLVIHAEFTDTPDIRTESSGKGKDRHVVIYFEEKKNTLS